MTTPVGPYTPIVRTGDWLVTSGQIGLRDGAMVEGFGAQVDQLLANLSDRLAEHGLDLTDVIKTTCMLVDLDRFAEFNERYAAAFPEPRPARSAFGVAALPLGASVEVEAWALRR